MDKSTFEHHLKNFKVLILDGDGVWFSVEELRGVLPDGSSIVYKSRSHHDGQGLSFLRGLGIRVLFASSEGEPLMSTVKKINELPSVLSGEWEPASVLGNLQKSQTKVQAIEKWLTQEGFSWDECVYMGDDRTDYEAMQKAACVVVPADARRVAKQQAVHVLNENGGRGAIREFAELVLDARGVDESTLVAA